MKMQEAEHPYLQDCSPLTIGTVLFNPLGPSLHTYMHHGNNNGVGYIKISTLAATKRLTKLHR